MEETSQNIKEVVRGYGGYVFSGLALIFLLSGGIMLTYAHVSDHEMFPDDVEPDTGRQVTSSLSNSDPLVISGYVFVGIGGFLLLIGLVMCMLTSSIAYFGRPPPAWTEFPYPANWPAHLFDSAAVSGDIDLSPLPETYQTSNNSPLPPARDRTTMDSPTSASSID